MLRRVRVGLRSFSTGQTTAAAATRDRRGIDTAQFGALNFQRLFQRFEFGVGRLRFGLQRLVADRQLGIPSGVLFRLLESVEDFRVGLFDLVGFPAQFAFELFDPTAVILELGLER